jgi:hypothetical protein
MPAIKRHPRIEARCAILTDCRLSPMARILYHLLDDLAYEGVVSAKQFNLGVRLQVRRQYIVELLAELEHAGHVVKTRGRYGIAYLLRWAEAIQMSPTDDTRCQPQATSGLITVQSSFPDSRAFACNFCRDTGIEGENYRGEPIACGCQRRRA